MFNPVGKRDAFYCTEVLNAQKVWLAKHGFDVSKLENQLLKPHDAYEMLLKTGMFECLKLAKAKKYHCIYSLRIGTLAYFRAPRSRTQPVRLLEPLA